MSFKQFLQEQWERAKVEVGAQAMASIRQGAGEMAQMLPAFPDSIRPVEEPGGVGNPVSQDLYRERHPDEFEHRLDRSATQVPKQQEPEMGMEK